MPASRRTPTRPFAVWPTVVSSGDVLVARFAEPIADGKVPSIAVGRKPLRDPRLIDAHTVVGVVADDRAGSKSVHVTRRRRAALASATLRHQGRRPGPRAGEPLHAVNHFSHHTRIPLVGGGPAASTWYMLGANSLHDANGRAAETALSPLWTRPASTPFTFWYAEPVLCADATQPGRTIVVLAPFTSSGQGETLAAVDASTGATLWTWTVTSGRSSILSTPVCVGRSLFAARGFANSVGVGPLMLVCADASTGATIWDVQLQPQAGLSNARLVPAAGSIVVLLDDGTIEAFDRVTGALLWQHVAAIPQTPNIGSDESIAAGWHCVFVGSTNGLRALDEQTGAPVWISPVAFDCSYSQILVTRTNPPLVIAADFGGTVHAFNALSGAHLWEFAGNKNWWPRMTCDFEHLWLQQTDTLVVLELRTGAVREVSPALGNETSGGPTQGLNAVFQAIAPNAASPGPSVLYAFDRSTVSHPRQKVKIHPTPTFKVRPVVEGTSLFVNVSPAAATNFADYSVIQAISLV